MQASDCPANLPPLNDGSAAQPLFEPRSLRGINTFDRVSLDFEIDAGNLVAAVLRTETCALAKFGKTDVAAAAEFQPRSNQDRVNINTNLPFKLKQQVDRA